MKELCNPRGGDHLSKLYGNYKDSKFSTGPHRARKKKKKGWLALPIVLVILAGLYCLAVFSNIPFIKYWRTVYIQTAMSTMRHQWLATYFIPQSVIDEAMAPLHAAEANQVGVNSDGPVLDTGDWDVQAEENPEFNTLSQEQQDFYKLFWELDLDSAEAYFADHPEVTAKGYGEININEAWLEDEGTSIQTTMGEQVLAIDAKHQILIVRVKGSTYRGVLCIAKDPSRLHLYPASHMGSYGETAGSIAQRNNGLLAMTGSSFIDNGGVGDGGDLAGYCMCDGVSYGDHMGWSNKRIELREDNWFWIVDAPTAVDERTTDAMEFTPALIINGEKMDVGEWTSMNPRACIGQSGKGEILMIGIEGRFLDSPGCSVTECTDILLRHKCTTALNLDGGTSAIVWYRGEPIMRCSNTAIPEGRYLPNAWVYVGDEE